MWIPETVKVGGHVYTVHQDYVFREGSDLSGQAVNGTQQIRLASWTPGGEPMARSNVEQTFIHELLHLVDYVYNARSLEEPAVYRLAEGLYQALNDSGMFVQDPPRRSARRRAPRRGRAAH